MRKIGDLGSFASGKTIPKSTGKIPVYGGNGIAGYVGDSNYPENTIVVGRVGANCGVVTISKERCWVTDNALAMTLKGQNDPHYVKYLLELLNLNKYHIGSSQPLITQGIIENIEFEYELDVTKQAVISNVLQTLDSKISNNNAIISELEAMAKVIYDYWFVQFDFPDENGRPYKSSGGKMVWNEDLKREIPEGWNSKKLGDVFNVTMGSSPEGETINETGNGIVFYQGRTDFGVRYPSQRTFTTAPKRFAEAEDVLLSVRAPVGDINRALQKCCIGRGIAAIHSQWPSFSYYSCLFLRPKFAKYNDGGTTFGCINGDDLSSIPIAIPDGNIIKQFELEVVPVDSRIRVAFEENVQLASLRDWLLPMLMNGQVKVGQKEFVYEQTPSYMTAASKDETHLNKIGD